MHSAIGDNVLFLRRQWEAEVPHLEEWGRRLKARYGKNEDTPWAVPCRDRSKGTCAVHMVAADTDDAAADDDDDDRVTQNLCQGSTRVLGLVWAGCAPSEDQWARAMDELRAFGAAMYLEKRARARARPPPPRSRDRKAGVALPRLRPYKAYINDLIHVIRGTFSAGELPGDLQAVVDDGNAVQQALLFAFLWHLAASPRNGLVRRAMSHSPVGVQLALEIITTERSPFGYRLGVFEHLFRQRAVPAVDNDAAVGGRAQPELESKRSGPGWRGVFTLGAVLFAMAGLPSAGAGTTSVGADLAAGSDAPISRTADLGTVAYAGIHRGRGTADSDLNDTLRRVAELGARHEAVAENLSEVMIAVLEADHTTASERHLYMADINRLAIKPMVDLMTVIRIALELHVLRNDLAPLLRADSTPIDRLKATDAIKSHESTLDKAMRAYHSHGSLHDPTAFIRSMLESTHTKGLLTPGNAHVFDFIHHHVQLTGSRLQSETNRVVRRGMMDTAARLYLLGNVTGLLNGLSDAIGETSDADADLEARFTKVILAFKRDTTARLLGKREEAHFVALLFGEEAMRDESMLLDVTLAQKALVDAALTYTNAIRNIEAANLARPLIQLFTSSVRFKAQYMTMRDHRKAIGLGESVNDAASALIAGALALASVAIVAGAVWGGKGAPDASAAPGAPPSAEVKEVASTRGSQASASAALDLSLIPPNYTPTGQYLVFTERPDAPLPICIGPRGGRCIFDPTFVDDRQPFQHKRDISKIRASDSYVTKHIQKS